MRAKLVLVAMLWASGAVAEQEAPCNPVRHAEVPAIAELKYHDARKKLLAAGWQPLQTKPLSTDASDPDIANGLEFWKRGYRELEACSGTGVAACRFLFRDAYGARLLVITGGEENPGRGSYAAVSNFEFVCDEPETQGATRKERQVITSRSAGPVRLGMTVAEARKALNAYSVKDFEADGAPALHVEQAGDWVMTMFTDDERPPLSNAAKIEMIRVGSSSFATAEGVGPGTPLAEAQQKYGKVTRLILTEEESREYAEFQRQPKGLAFQVDDGQGNEAGVYPTAGGGGRRLANPSRPRGSSRFGSAVYARATVIKLSAL